MVKIAKQNFQKRKGEKKLQMQLLLLVEISF